MDPFYLSCFKRKDISFYERNFIHEINKAEGGYWNINYKVSDIFFLVKKRICRVVLIHSSLSLDKKLMTEKVRKNLSFYDNVSYKHGFPVIDISINELPVIIVVINIFQWEEIIKDYSLIKYQIIKDKNDLICSKFLLTEDLHLPCLQHLKFSKIYISYEHYIKYYKDDFNTYKLYVYMEKISNLKKLQINPTEFYVIHD